MKTVFLTCIITCLAACSYHYSISEQQINAYLAQQQHLKQQLGLPGLLKLDADFSELRVDIGHQQQRIRLNSHAQLSLQSLLQDFDASFSSAISAEPWFDAEQGAIYLRNIQLEQVTLQPVDIAPQLQIWLPQLNLILNQLLQESPIYVLDEQDSAQALAKSWGKELTVAPGELVFTIAP